MPSNSSICRVQRCAADSRKRGLVAQRTAVTVEAFPDDTAPRWLLRDRDAIYGDTFQRRVAGMGIHEVLRNIRRMLVSNYIRPVEWPGPYFPGILQDDVIVNPGLKRSPG